MEFHAASSDPHFSHIKDERGLATGRLTSCQAKDSKPQKGKYAPIGSLVLLVMLSEIGHFGTHWHIMLMFLGSPVVPLMNCLCFLVSKRLRE